jgi:hypothetical protein
MNITVRDTDGTFLNMHRDRTTEANQFKKETFHKWFRECYIVSGGGQSRSCISR